MRREGNLMTCTVAGLTKYLRDNIVVEDGDWIAVPECDFCIIDDDNVKYTLKEIHGKAERWYGLKVVNGGFNSNDLVLMADYYGGGCAHIVQIWDDGFGVSDHTIQDLTKLIVDTLCEQDVARYDTLLMVEFTAKKKYIARISALKYGEVQLLAESEEQVKDKVVELFVRDGIKWHSGELTDITVEEVKEDVQEVSIS